MKKLTIAILLLLLAGPCLAEEYCVGDNCIEFPGKTTITLEDPWTQYARMNVGIVGGGVAATSSPTYYYTGGLTINDFTACTEGTSTSLHMGAIIPVGKSGTAKKMGAKLNHYQGNYGVNFCMYTGNGDTLLASGSKSSGGTGVQWLEVDIDVAVTATNYIVVWSPEFTAYGCTNATPDEQRITQAYSGGCKAAPVTPTVLNNIGFGVSLYVE
jgi:hypothetical protein